MVDVYDLGRALRASLEALPYPVYRRALERILFEEVDRMYGDQMSREQRDVWERTVAAARSGVTVPAPFDPDGMAAERIDPVLAGLIADWEHRAHAPQRGVNGALGVMQVYVKELAGVYPPYETADYLGYAFEDYLAPPRSEVFDGIVNLAATTYQPVDSPAGDELRKCLRLVEAFANGGTG